MQTFVITRAVFSILAVPIVLIGGAVAAVGVTFYFFTINPLLALIPLIIGVVSIAALARWEKGRVDKEMRSFDDG
jgi:hypothetical protein